jgi:hypothetical protein
MPWASEGVNVRLSPNPRTNGDAAHSKPKCWHSLNVIDLMTLIRGLWLQVAGGKWVNAVTSVETKEEEKEN